MAASVSTTPEAITTASAVSGVMSLLVERLNDVQREKLSQWIRHIEEHAEKVVQDLAPAQLKRRNMEVVTAAAVYDAFLEYETRTEVKLRLPLMHEVLGKSQCSINTTWNKLFDHRGSMRGDQLDVVYVGKSTSLSEAITNVVRALTKAVDGLTRVMKKWLEDIEEEALELSQSVPQKVVNNYDILTAAVTFIYAAIQLHHGKMQVRIAQRDLSLLSATSPALISKCWLELSKARR
jgi:hypothetical protein